MSDRLTRFEFLPNELLIDIFRYIDAQDLFRAFYDLNTRLNTLLHSFDDLSMIVRKCDNNNSNYFKSFTSCICNLILYGGVDIDLNSFTNIRYLTLRCVTLALINQLESDILPNLEHLSIGYQYFSIFTRYISYM